ncbi:MAG: beta propeller repeat protein [Rectinema subterraneum]
MNIFGYSIKLDKTLATGRAKQKNAALSRKGSGIAGLYAALALTLLVLFAGCDNSFSIFKSISQETKQVGVDLFKNVTVRAMANDAANYYALLGQVVWRPIDGSASWNVLSVNGSTDYFAAGLASDGAKVYVAKANSNNVLEDVYKTIDSGATWTAMNAAASIGSSAAVDWLKCANGTLFVAFHASGTYSLYYYDGAAFKSAGIANISRPLIDIVWDGSEYWAISDSAAYHGAAGAMTEDTAPALAQGLIGLATDSAGRVLISRSDGLVYSLQSGAWTQITIKASTKLGPLFLLTQPAATKTIMVSKGIATYGYYEYDETGTGSLKENGSSYVSTTSSVYLSTMLSKHVIGFWQPSNDANILYVMLAAGGTDSYALYKNTFDPAANAGAGAWSGWTAK